MKAKRILKRMFSMSYINRCISILVLLSFHDQYPEHQIRCLNDLFYWPEGINLNFISVWGIIVCSYSLLCSWVKYMKEESGFINLE